MVLYKVIRILFLDEAINVFFNILKKNSKPTSLNDFPGDVLEKSKTDLPVYKYTEDGKVQWVAFDDDNFPLGFFPTENQAIEAWFSQWPEVPIGEGDLL